MTDRSIGVGPFTSAKSDREGHAVVLDAAGEAFCYVDREDCAGCDLAGAKARAQRIAESLNLTEVRGA